LQETLSGAAPKAGLYDRAEPAKSGNTLQETEGRFEPSNGFNLSEVIMKKIIALALLAASLGGCVVYPAPYPRAYVAAPAVVYAPRPYYYWHY
jgi:hypothetical protein